MKEFSVQNLTASLQFLLFQDKQSGGRQEWGSLFMELNSGRLPFTWKFYPGCLCVRIAFGSYFYLDSLKTGSPVSVLKIQEEIILTLDAPNSL